MTALTHWKIVAAALVAVVVATLSGVALYYRGQALKAEGRVAEFQHAYEVLAQAAQRQAQAMSELEEEAAAAAARGAQARREAQAAVEVARRSADALTRALRAPRPDVECPVNSAVEIIREDLAGGE